MLPPSAEYLAFAAILCDKARTITGKYFRQKIDIKDKYDNSPVTVADRQTEARLREMIAQKYPGHGIIGEEYGNSGASDLQWVIDPIDGTRSFISGFPIYCTLIALLYQEEVVFSIIDMPQLNERFSAAHDQKTQLNGVLIHTSTQTELKNATVFSTDPGMFNPTQFAQRQALTGMCKLERWSGDGYLYAMLAAGWIDLVIEADLKPYDFLPLQRIVEQAGGVISDWQGNPLTRYSKGEVLACANRSLQQQALIRLN